ncbi:MAG TPA: methyltransferase [Polyangia bacterium]|nr:methyltransferase [Polyangia bacterium]
MADVAPDAVTADALLQGRVRLYQPARGARMSLDPVLLAGFLTPPFGRFLDIGCGAGPLSFLLLARDPDASGVGVEIQARLAGLARRGRDDNGWAARLEIVEGDVRQVAVELEAGAFDVVVTNPPYRTVENSPPSPDRERALAHHEITLRLGEWIDVAARAVRRSGRVAAILPVARAGELFTALEARGLHPVRAREVVPRASQAPSRILVEASPSGASGRPPHERLQEPPLVVHEADGTFTPEVRRLLGEPVRS